MTPTRRLPISAAVIARNATRTLGATLASLDFLDDVVVVDSGSSDHTVALARESGARVSYRAWTGFRDQKNAAAALARHDWILSLDADEAVTERLRDDIARRFDPAPPSVAGFQVSRLTRYLGREIRGAGWYPDRAVRLYDRTRGRWVGGQVHERIEVDGPVDALVGDLLHDPYADIVHHLAKMNEYTTLGAETLHARGRRPRWSDLAVRPPATFLKKYLAQRGMRDGIPGFVVSASASIAVFLKYAKLWDLARRGAPRTAEAAADESPPHHTADDQHPGPDALTSRAKEAPE